MELQRLIADYLMWHEVSGHSSSTIGWYRWNLGAFERWLRANGHATDVAAITINDVRAFLYAEAHRNVIRPEHPTGIERPGRLSDRTLHCYARAIRAFFTWLVAEEYLQRNPVARLKPPKLEDRMKEILSVDEIERLLSLCNQKTFLGLRMYAIIALLYDSGLRAGELVRLELEDVNWREYHIRVMGKGKKERLVPFSRVTHRALHKYIELRAKFAIDGVKTFFITTDGQPLTVNGMRHALKRLGIRAGVPRLHPHLLRHSAAVASIMNGANQFELKRILGHTQLSTTDGYMDYAQQHLAEQHRQFSPMERLNHRAKGRPNRNPGRSK